MTVLGIETSTVVCGAAISRGGEVIALMELNEERVHAEQLLPCIKNVLEQSDLKLNEVDCIAVSAGPGSFTGLRIGLSAAKGLAYAAEKPLVAVPTLASLARRTLEGCGGRFAGHILVLLDARRDEVYCQLFRATENGLQEEWPVQDVRVSDLIERLGNTEVLVTGNAMPKFKALTGENPGQYSWVASPTNECSAGIVARMGDELFQQNCVQDPVTFEPLYIKEFFTQAK